MHWGGSSDMHWGGSSDMHGGGVVQLGGLDKHWEGGVHACSIPASYILIWFKFYEFIDLKSYFLPC